MASPPISVPAIPVLPAVAEAPRPALASSAAPGAAPRGRFYAPELDLLRLFAFAMVFGRHVVTGFGLAHRGADAPAATAAAPQAVSAGKWALAQGLAQSLDFGVCLFFLLSSFLITRLLLLELDRTGRVEVGRFLGRRALRIWPLYFVFLAAMAAANRALPALHVGGARLLATLVFLGNWPVVLRGWAGSPIELLWSVSVEEQFYLLWPWCARWGRRGVLAVSAALFTIAPVTIALVGSRPGTHSTALWANSLVQCLFFAAGASLAVWGKPEDARRPFAQRLLLFAGGWAAWLAASAGCHVVRTASPPVPLLLAGYGLVLIGTAGVFLAFAGWRPGRVPPLLLFGGKITYGLYVFHFFSLEIAGWVTPRLFGTLGWAPHSPVLPSLFSALLGLLLTVALATASYLLLEKPFLRLKEHLAVVASRPA